MTDCRPIRKSTRMARKGRVPECPTTTQMSDSKPAAIRGENPKKCMSPGPVQRNPFLNFLREYRKNNCGLTAVETVRKGAEAWKSLSKEEKIRYIVEAFYAPKRRRRSSKALCGPVGRRMSRHSGKLMKRSQSAKSRSGRGKKRRLRSARRGRVC